MESIGEITVKTRRREGTRQHHCWRPFGGSSNARKTGYFCNARNVMMKFSFSTNNTVVHLEVSRLLMKKSEWKQQEISKVAKYRVCMSSKKTHLQM